MEATLYNQKGKEAGTIALPDAVFGVKWNADLVHQVLVGMQSNKRAGTANARTRAEVSGGGKKPWKQKGTGRARHGSTRSPIWIGGGVTHGPLAEKVYDKKINKKMRIKALYSILSAKQNEGSIIFVDAITADGKTKTGADVVKALASIKGFEKLSGAKKPVATVIFPAADEMFVRSFRNLPELRITPAIEANALDLASSKYVIVAGAQASVDILSGKMAGASKKKAAAKAA